DFELRFPEKISDTKMKLACCLVLIAAFLQAGFCGFFSKYSQSEGQLLKALQEGRVTATGWNPSNSTFLYRTNYDLDSSYQVSIQKDLSPSIVQYLSASYLLPYNYVDRYLDLPRSQERVRFLGK